MAELIPFFIMIGLIIGFLLLGVPVLYTIGLVTGSIALFYWDLPLALMPIKLVEVGAWSYLALPLFMLGGELMTVMGITDTLIRFARSLVGYFRGGLSHVAVLTNVILAGLSGSAVADLAAVGPILIPGLTRAGYPKEYATTICAVSALIGPLIPPSVPAIIYCLAVDASIGDLFLALVAPGLMVAGMCIIVGYMTAVKKHFPRDAKFEFHQATKAFLPCIPAMFIPFVIVGGIRSGLFTPTEGGGVLVIVVALVGLFYHFTKLSRMRLPDVFEAMKRSAIVVSVVMSVVGISYLFGHLVSLNQLGPKIAYLLTHVIKSKEIILFLIMVLILILGCFLDLVPIILIFAPILLPVVEKYGVDQIHFGCIMIFGSLIGMITPPYGLILLLSAKMSDVNPLLLFRTMFPFFIGMVLIFIMITFIPQISLFFPHLIRGQ